MAVKLIFAIIVIITACHLVYLNNLDTPFQFDDHWQIVGNYYIRNTGYLATVLWEQPRRFALWLTFSLNYTLSPEAAGNEPPGPWGFHFVNNWIHAINGVLVFVLALIWLGRLRNKPDSSNHKGNERSRRNFNILAAFLAGMIFVLHPLLSEGVTYVSGRSSSMCTTFCLLALVFYFLARRSGERRRYILAVYFAAFSFVSFAIAVLSKELGIALPLLLLLTEVCFLSRGSFRRAVRAWPYWSPFAAVFAFAAGFAIWRLLTVGAIFQHEGVLSPRYLLGQCEVVSRYLGMLLYPTGLNINHAYPEYRGFEPRFIPFIAIIAALVAAGFAAGRLARASGRANGLLISAAIFWFLFSLAPTSSIFALGDWMVERRVYLASVLPIMCAGVGLAYLARAAFARARGFRFAFVAVLMLILGALAAGTVTRNHDYRSRLSLWQKARALQPDDFRIRYSIGLGWLERAALFFEEGKHIRMREALGNATAGLDYAEEIEPGKQYHTLLLSARVDVAALYALAAERRTGRGEDPGTDKAIAKQFERALALARQAWWFAPNREEGLKTLSEIVGTSYLLGHFCYVSGRAYENLDNRELEEKFFRKCESTLLYGIEMYNQGISDWPALEKPRLAWYHGFNARMRSHWVLSHYYRRKENQQALADYHEQIWGGGQDLGSPESLKLREFFSRWARDRLGG